MHAVKVLTVLRSGGEYEPKHVYALRDMVAEHMPAAEFVCLTDHKELDVESIPLEHNWPGWWSKMELYDVHGPCVYFDLDTIIVSSLEWLEPIAHGPFTMLRDAYRGKKDPKARQSSMMAWGGDVAGLLYTFAGDSHAYMQRYARGGDQLFAEHNSQSLAFQDLAPGKAVSFKADLEQGPPAPEASVVFFHGKPRPWDQTVIPYPA